MGNYPHTAQDFEHAEDHTFGSIIDPWVTAYNFEKAGGQTIHTKYRTHMKLVSIYASGGRMWGLRPDKTKIWLSDEQGRPYPDSVNRVKGVEGYGAGPMMLISGTVEVPEFHMKIGSELNSEWSWAQINSFHDIENAMSMNKGAYRIHNLANQDFDSKHLGTASRNLFLDVKPGDINSWAHDFNKSVDTIGSQLIIGAAEAVVDEFVPFASTVFQLSGGEAAAQKALDNFVNKKYSSSTASMWEAERTRKLDPYFMESIHDARISERFDQLQPYLTKYGGPDLANLKSQDKWGNFKYDKKRRMDSINNYTKFVTRWHVNEQMDLLEKQVEAAKRTLGTQDFDFSFFRKDWKLAKDDEVLSYLNHYKKQFVDDVLPKLEDHGRMMALVSQQEALEKTVEDAKEFFGPLIEVRDNQTKEWKDAKSKVIVGWKNATVKEKQILFTQHHGLSKLNVIPGLRAKLRGFDTDYKSAAQTDKKYRDKFGRKQQSQILGRTLIMGDVVSHQKGGSSKQSIVQG